MCTVAIHSPEHCPVESSIPLCCFLDSVHLAFAVALLLVIDIYVYSL